MSEKRKSDEFAPEKEPTCSKKFKNGSSSETASGSLKSSEEGKGVKIKLGLNSKKAIEKNQPKLIVTDTKIKQIFNEEDDDAEIMPGDAKMKMRNVGRDTPTSSGPNSFSKGKGGFVDIRKLSEKKLDELTKKLCDELP